MPARIKDTSMKQEIPKRTFDWRPVFDERSRNYAIRSMLGDRVIKRVKTEWREGTVLDQGSEGACVGFGWMSEILAEPVEPDEQPTEELGNQLAQYYYKEAQKIDEWEGENYSGTSVLAGAKIMQKYGLISEYRWCFSIDDVIDTVIAKGPVVIGIPWYQSMYSTGKTGLVTVSGNKVGGHCITITGYDPAKKIGSYTYEVLKWRNSWGNGYGINGSAYIKVSDLKKLLADGGEACVPLIRHKPVLEYPPTAKKNAKVNIFSWLISVFKTIIRR